METRKIIHINLSVNGREVHADVPEDMNLLQFLRGELGLTGSKNGCEKGHCGACTVIINGEAKRACLSRMNRLDGVVVETIEGLAENGSLHPVQQAFLETGAVQCGFCTPGMVMSAKALLDENPDPTREEIKTFLTKNRNLCRCTGYGSILDAVRLAADRMAGLNAGAEPRSTNGLLSNRQLKQDAVEKVTGSCIYADDIVMDKMLYGKILWAEHPHARILEIDTSEAEAVDGVVAVITARDIPGKNQAGLVVRDQPAIADVKTRYIGDGLASVFAETEEIAEYALNKIKVSYDPLPGVFTPQDAGKPDAPKVHESGNLVRHAAIERGDVEEAFKECAVVIEGEYTTPFTEHGFLEPESGIAYPDGDGGLVLESGTQTVFDDRIQLSEILDLPEEKIRLVQISGGGAFGGKEDLIYQQHIALAALRTGRPAKITLTREESLRTHPKRHPAWIKYKTGATKDGKILAIEAEVILDAGAYTSLSIDVLENTVVFGSGPYYIPNLKIEGRAWYTNNMPCGAMRGFGVNQIAVGLEQQIDAMARALNIDPFDIREINAVVAGLPTGSDHLLEEGVDGIKETVQAAKDTYKQIKQPKPEGNKKIGFGVASAVKNVGFGHGIPESAGAIIKLNSYGDVKITVTHHEYGQGGLAGEIRIASEELGIPVARFEIDRPDTAITPKTGPTTASRQTFLTGNAVVLACKGLKEEVFSRAAEALNIPPEQLAFEESRVVDKSSGNSIELKELGDEFVIERSYDSPQTDQMLEGEESRFGSPDFKSLTTHVMYSYTTQVAVVEVDTSSGDVKVLKLIAVCDVGKALNPQIIRGQIAGGVMMGLGAALSEIFVIENGINTTDSLHKIHLPTAADTPEIIPVIVEVPHPFSPHGMKGFAEAPSLATAPAILNAVYDAVGVRICEIPIDSRKLRDAIKEKAG
jgi:aldehyde oxidoreductase